jgi:hypothetical protein
MKPTREIERETDATVYEGGEHRAIVLIIKPGKSLAMRLKGTRTRYDVPVNAVWRMAVEMAARKGK